MAMVYTLSVWYTCGHTSKAQVSMDVYHRNRGQPIKPGQPCHACEQQAKHSEYMRELEVRAAFESECG